MKLSDAGLDKVTIRRWCLAGKWDDQDFARKVLARLDGPDEYTESELRDAASLCFNAHDQCILDNSEDFTPIEIYWALRNQRLDNSLQARIDRVLKETK